MEKSAPSLTKICANCGREKPLTAFLQLGDSHKTLYGNLCANCRGQVSDNENAGDETHEGERLTLEYKIDNKAKIQNDLEKKQHFEKVEEEYRKDREKLEKTQRESSDRHDSSQHDEKKHRESYLERASFLGTGKPATAREQVAKQQVAERALHQEHATKEEIKQKNIDTTAPFLDTQIAGKEKFTRGIAFKEFATRLGTAAPIFNAVQTKEANQKKQAESKQTAEEFIKKNWQPKSRR